MQTAMIDIKMDTLVFHTYQYKVNARSVTAGSALSASRNLSTFSRSSFRRVGPTQYEAKCMSCASSRLRTIQCSTTPIRPICSAYADLSRSVSTVNKCLKSLNSPLHYTVSFQFVSSTDAFYSVVS